MNTTTGMLEKGDTLYVVEGYTGHLETAQVMKALKKTATLSNGAVLMQGRPYYGKQSITRWYRDGFRSHSRGILIAFANLEEAEEEAKRRKLLSSRGSIADWIRDTSNLEAIERFAELKEYFIQRT